MYLVADADRERGLALLRRCYAEGRLSVEELADRVEVLARARTTGEMRRALRDLPHGATASELVPRLEALRASPAGVAVARRVVRAGVALGLVAVWLTASLVLLATLAVVQLVSDAGSGTTAGFLLAWLALTWLTWRVWRAGAHRV